MDVGSLLITDTIPLNYTAGMCAFNIVTNELCVADKDNGKVNFFVQSQGTWKAQGSISTGKGTLSVQFNADGSKAYITNGLDGTVSAIATSTKAKLATVAVGKLPNGITLKQ